MPQTELFAMLRQQGYRLTPQRLQVLQIVSTHQQHLTAEEIFALIVPHQPSLDIATVYRTLQWLETVGLIAPLKGNDDRTRYEYHPHGNQHHHLICEGCGHTMQIPCELITPLKAALRQGHGFVLNDHLTLLGMCQTCNSAAS